MQFVNDRVEAEVCAKNFGIEKFHHVALRAIFKIGGSVGDTKFVEVKKQTHYGCNTASTGPFEVIYGSITCSRPSRQVLKPFEWAKNIDF